MWYNIRVEKINTREWRNWQTRTFEGRVVHTVRVQVPFLAPTKRVMTVGHHPFGLCENKDAEPLAVACDSNHLRASRV